MTNQAFFYIDGIPTKGTWVNLDTITEWDEVRDELSKALQIESDNIDEILCADVEGLPRHFYASSCDSFSMNEWRDFKDAMESTHLDEEVIEAFIEYEGGNFGVSVDEIEDAYQGHYDTLLNFACELLEDTGELNQIPEHLQRYFDYEAFAHDLSFDYFESNGHIFRKC